jgi:PAS domain S-box-containing protein
VSNAAEQEFLSRTQALAHVGSWEWDLAADAITWSAETYHIFGAAPTPQPFTYEGYLALIHPDDRAAVRAAVVRALETLVPFAVDYRIVRPDGAVRFLWGRGGVLSDSTGRPARLAGVVLDITPRCQAEETLRRLAASVAHDCNNLLTAILGSGDFLLEILPPGHPGREEAEAVRQAALRAGELTRQLLTFGRQQP